MDVLAVWSTYTETWCLEMKQLTHRCPTKSRGGVFNTRCSLFSEKLG